MLRAYKYRLYPTDEQQKLINQTMGCARFVYNWALDIMIKDNEAWRVFIKEFVSPLHEAYPLPERYKKLSQTLKLKLVFYALTESLKTHDSLNRLYADVDFETTTGERAINKAKAFIGFFLEQNAQGEFARILYNLPETSAAIKDLVVEQWVPTRYSKYDLSRMLTIKKKDPEFVWLKEAYSVSLIAALSNLDTAFQNFFKRLKNIKPGMQAGYPKFKKRWNRQSMQFHQHYSVDFHEGTVSVPKVGDVTCKFHREFKGTLKTATISRTPGGRYYISILVEVAAEKLPALSGPDRVLGIDHGIHHFITTSDGKRWERYKVSEKLIKRERLEARRLSRKEKDSNGRYRQRLKLAQLKERIASSRDGYIQHVTNELIKYAVERGYDTLVLRYYDIQKMMRKPEPVVDKEKSTPDKIRYARNGAKAKRKLNKEITNVAWGRFIQVLKAKGLKKGILVEDTVPAADTSIKCSHCGHVAKENVKGRVFHCVACGIEKDVDLNAAINTREDYLSLRKVVVPS